MGDIKKILVPGRVPSPTTFKPDELVVNPIDGKIYMKKLDNTVIEIGSGSFSGSLDTGSLLADASVAGSTITFTRGDSSTFDIVVTAAGTPGGSNTQVQFNDGGALGGDSDFTYNKTTNKLTVSGEGEFGSINGGTF